MDKYYYKYSDQVPIECRKYFVDLYEFVFYKLNNIYIVLEYIVKVFKEL
jgi:hypothetical protein